MRQPFSRRLDGEQCHARLRQWVEQCTGCHDLCRMSTSASLPSRVLCLGDSAIRLHVSAAGDISPYAALSHC